MCYWAGVGQRVRPVGAVDRGLVPWASRGVGLLDSGWGGGMGWARGLSLVPVVPAGRLKGCPVTTSMRTKTVMITLLGWTAASAVGL